MKTNIKTTNLVLTPDIKDYLDKKLEDIERIIDRDNTSVSCQVELGRTTYHHQSGDIFRAEINLHKDGKYFRAVSEQDSIMAALDEVKDEILRELKSFSSKQQTMMRRGGAMIKNMMRGIGGAGGRAAGSIGELGGRVGRNLSRNIGGQFNRFRRKG